MGHPLVRQALVLPLLLAAGFGCSQPAVKAPPAVAWPREKVAILIPWEEPPFEFQKPVSGTMSGLGVGFGRGVVLTLLLALSGAATGNIAGVFASTFLAGAFGTVYIPASSIGGAVSADSFERVARAEAGLRSAMMELHVNRKLGQRLQEAFRDMAGRDLPVVEEGPDAPRAAPPGTEWLLEVRILGIWNGETRNMMSVDRPCELFVAAGLRLVRASDGVAVAGRVAIFKSPVAQYTFSEWGDERGRRLKEDVTRACALLAESFVEELYLSTLHLRRLP